MSQTDETYAIILAGGSGTRFWPLSREKAPKQLLRLFGNTTLLEQTIARLEGFIPVERTLILTNVAQEEEIRKLLPEFPPENILAEPEKRDTAPAIAIGIGWVAARNPSATMIILPADHLVNDVGAFASVLGAAAHAARSTNAMVTIGIKPTWACPGYGYIERGSRAILPGLDDFAIFEVKRFREKPNADLAEEYLKTGLYSWNAGIFAWSVSAVLGELSRHCPELVEFVRELRFSQDFAATVKAQFGSLPRISIDYALMEKATRVLNIEATFDWDDVGSWTSVAKYLPEDALANRSNTALIADHSHENIVFSQDKKRLIALLGVSNLIVVETPDALLIAEVGQADAIKRLVSLVPSELQ